MTIFLLISVAFAQSPNEAWPSGSAADTYYTAEQQYKDSDKKLNMIYKKLLNASYANTTPEIAIRHLVEAQKTWIKFRDTTCAMEGELRGGWPTWKSAKEMICKSEMTIQRIKDLENLFFDCCQAPPPQQK